MDWTLCGGGSAGASGKPSDWQRALALVGSLMRFVWGLEPDARPAPQALVERSRGPAA